MKWLELTVYTNDAGLDGVCAALSGVGLDQVRIEESHEKAMAFLNERAVYWDFADPEQIGVDEPCVIAYLADGPGAEAVLSDVKDALTRLRGLSGGADIGSLSVAVSRVDDADWENAWKAYYKPLLIGTRLYVTPCWIDEPVPEGRTRLRLDPGAAFGTGEHQTTRMCLEFLERAVRPDDCMLDLGCGSGILSIAALLLGANAAVAVDIDPGAERVARENAALNGVDNARFRVEIGDALSDEPLRARIADPYDVIAANIVSGVIIALAPFARQCAKPGARFVVSGIIDEREAEVAGALAKAGFHLQETSRLGGWVAMLLTV